MSTPPSTRRIPRGSGPAPRPRASTNRVHGYFATAARTAAVRFSPCGEASVTSSVAMMRYVCALPSNPSASPSSSRASRSSTRSPRWPNGGCPRSCALAAACTTTASQPCSRVSSNAGDAASVSPTAIARETAVTLMEWVRRLWMSGPAPGCAITWVTAESREKYGENRMRSRSSRNCECSPMTSTLLRGSVTRRAVRSAVILPI